MVFRLGKRFLRFAIYFQEDFCQIRYRGSYVVRHIGLYNPMKSKFSSWVFKIVMNTLDNRFKRSKKEEHTESIDERPEKGF
jgi:hypothetical protein